MNISGNSQDTLELLASSEQLRLDLARIRQSRNPWHPRHNVDWIPGAGDLSADLDAGPHESYGIRLSDD